MRHRWLLVPGGLLLAAATSAQPPLADTGLSPAGPEDFELTFDARAFPELATPPLPDPSVFPIQLVLDDDQAEGVFGFAGSTARQFLWFQRFDSPGPFILREIWVLFPSAMDVPLGGEVQLAVYLDRDGDPSTGAELLATYDGTIQAVDGATFSVYPLSPGVQVVAAGDVLIGVVSRFFETGVDPPPTRPAALDTTVSQNRAWFALWPGDPPDPPELDDALVIDVLDGAVSGNWMIRGFGISPPVTAIPILGGAGLAILALLLSGAATARLRRR